MRQLMTAEEYRIRSPDCELSDNELEKLLDVSQQSIYVYTCGRIGAFDSMSEERQENILKAIAAQTDYISSNFGAQLCDGIPESATIGSFSYNMGISFNQSDSSPAVLDKTALMYLKASGLLGRGGVLAV